MMYTTGHHSSPADITKTALCMSVLCLSSYLVIPLPFTPVVLSMHTVIVNLIGLILTPKQAAFTILSYLLMGGIGLPVFSGSTGGPGKLFGPTGGFYFGFLFSVIAISLFRGKKNHVIPYALVTMCIGMPIQHLFGVLWMCFHNGFQIQASILSVSLPFIPGDIVKCVIASVLGVAINKRLRHI